MASRPDYSILDDSVVSQTMFYPREDWTPTPAGAEDFMVPVEENVDIACRFYPVGNDSPSILFFHGNGEVVCDYDWIAPFYNHRGISLFVADYRGYGQSSGWPSFSKMMSDAEAILDFFVTVLRERSHTGPLFIMGRSMGTHSALALAALNPGLCRGLIVESGSANVTRLLKRFGLPTDSQQARGLNEATAARIRSITLPVLIIHGEWDTLVPPTLASDLYEAIGSSEKRLVLIPEAGHNDIMVVGMAEYFAAIKRLVFPGGDT